MAYNIMIRIRKGCSSRKMRLQKTSPYQGHMRHNLTVQRGRDLSSITAVESIPRRVRESNFTSNI